MRAWLRYSRHVVARHAAFALDRIRPIRRRAICTAHETIGDILQHARPSDSATPVTVKGWVKSIRKQKRIAFATITDGSCLEPLQAVLEPGQAEFVTNGAAVKLHGKYTASPEGKEQASELRVDSVQLLGDNNATTNPIQKKYQTLEFLRTLPHLRACTARNALLLRLRSYLISRASGFFDRAGYTQTHTPIITSSDCEGAGEVFEIGRKAVAVQSIATQAKHVEHNFFGSPKYLTVSSQLHLEALAQSVGKVWTLSPTFRAEKSDTTRHLSEFYMLEAELCFTESLKQVMKVSEDLIKFLVCDLGASELGKELEISHAQSQIEESAKPAAQPLHARWDCILREKWHRITYHEAVSVLKTATAQGRARFTSEVGNSTGLQTEHERYLVDTVGDGSPVFVTDYPRAIKPFYMAPSQDVSQDTGPVSTVACFDLLMPEACEVVGGSLREHRLDPLRDAMQKSGLLGGTDGQGRRPHNLEWYLDLRRYGGVPHGGFGLGFDRFLGYVAGVRNIRDTVAFPRWHGRCDC